MAEQELELLIKLRDEATAHLENINKALGTNTEKWKDTYKATSDASNAGEQMLSGMTGKIRVLGISIGQLATSWVGLGAAIAAVGAVAITNAINIAKTVQEMHNLSIETGFSVQALSQWKYIAELSGKSISNVYMGMRGLAMAMEAAKSPTTEQAKAFRELEISLSELKELSPEDLFMRVGIAISKLEDPFRRISIAKQLFGLMGPELLSIFDDLARKGQLAEENAPDLRESAKGAEELRRALTALSAAWDNLRIGMANITFPALIVIIDAITSVIKFLERIQNMKVEPWKLDIGFPDITEPIKIPVSFVPSDRGLSPLDFGVWGIHNYQQGGIVPGPIGQPIPIIAHGGEQYLGAGQGMGGNITVNVNVAGSIRSDQDIASVIRREVLLAKQRNYNAGLA